MKVFIPNFEKRGGIIPVVTQDYKTGKILTLAYVNMEAYQKTLETRRAYYYSTSRKKVVMKGATSGNIQIIRYVLIDCDGDALIYCVDQVGKGACHTNAFSCFYRDCIGAKQIMPAPLAGKTEELETSEMDICSDFFSANERSSDTQEIVRFAIPNGSLGPRTRDFLVDVGYSLRKPGDDGYLGTSGGIAFYERNRRMIPILVANGAFDAGITGKDLFYAVEDELKGVIPLEDLCFSRQSNQPTRWVLASKDGILEDKKSIRIGCELPKLASKLLESKSMPRYTIVQIEGNEECAIDDGLCDAILVVTETGSSLEKSGLKIVQGFSNLLVSVPQVISRVNLSEDKNRIVYMLCLALRSAIASNDQVMVTSILKKGVLQTINLPASVSPTLKKMADDRFEAVEICIPRSLIPNVLMILKYVDAQATAIQDLKGFLV